MSSGVKKINGGHNSHSAPYRDMAWTVADVTALPDGAVIRTTLGSNPHGIRVFERIDGSWQAIGWDDEYSDDDPEIGLPALVLYRP